MIIVGDATAWSVIYNCHSDDSRGVIYDRNIFIILAVAVIITALHFLCNIRMGPIY